MVLVMFLYTFMVLLISALFIIYWKLVRSQKRLYDALRRQSVPGEPFVPVIGQFFEMKRAWSTDIFMCFEMEQIRKYGHIFLIGFGPLIYLNVLEPDLLADILGRSHADDYIKSDEFISLFKPIIGVHNLLVSKGEEHERARKMLNPAFHFVNLQSMVSIMTDQIVTAIDGFVAMSAEQGRIDLQIELNKLTLAIIASSAFGKDFETMPNAKEIVCRAFTEVLTVTEYRSSHMINQIPFLAKLPFWGKNIVDKGSREVAHFVDQIVAERRHGRSTSLCASGDILDLLLSAVDTQGQPFTDQEIKEQALTFVLAGHETTSSLMTWAMYVLMTNERVLTACRDEIDRVLPNGIEPTYETVAKLAVCEAVLKETLRLYPPAVYFTRQCVREHTIGSKDHRQLNIPVGTIIFINTYFLHRRADFWPRPLEFDYTRWMRDPTTGLKPKLAHPFCYLPFAAGPRNCIGQNFALLEAKVMLALLVQRCTFELECGQKIVPDVHLTMRPKYGLRARIIKRQ